MATVEVTEVNHQLFDVTVIDQSTTQHRVTVQQAYADQLTQGKFSSKDLIQKSFDFLLTREPNTSILKRFDLTVISRYFPEFEHVINQ